jgi:hypothetical protein
MSRGVRPMEEGKIEMVAELMPNKLRLGEECEKGNQLNVSGRKRGIFERRNK